MTGLSRREVTRMSPPVGEPGQARPENRPRSDFFRPSYQNAAPSRWPLSIFLRQRTTVTDYLNSSSSF